MKLTHVFTAFLAVLLLTTCRSEPKETVTNNWTRSGNTVEIENAYAT